MAVPGLKPPAIAGWCLYDWAMSAFNTVIGTFVFSVYFTKGVAADPDQGSADWAFMLGLSGLLIACLSPVLGAIADRGGRIKPWLAACTVIAIIGSASLWFIRPDPSYALPALLLVGIASTAFELSNVFYNALLPVITPRSHLGRVSGWGWGVGYLGGLVCLILCLVLLLQSNPPLFGLIGTDEAQPVRATSVLVAVWYAVFALPLFLLVPDRLPEAGMNAARAVREGWASLVTTIRAMPRHANTLRFLIASALWRDGINTITAFGGIYAGIVFGMVEAQLILFAIALNVAAGLGAIGFAWADDRIGAKPTLLISLTGLIITGTSMVLVGTDAWAWAPVLSLPLEFTPDQQWLLLLGMGLGVFFGPAQAAARSMMARISPPGLETEFFGIYALTGRAVGVLGPLAYGFAVTALGTQRAGMASVIVLFLLGTGLLLTVTERR
ncbi:MFS transporter [Niveispirillum sp.]|uniref:MFS transporter n=1 Tax=Niveispirillum sp. TaxID=1917217 RepID=UPI001B45FCB9|nr:MFS transporter [Niveispirillum sp.]MBP7337351.1 MFS transporter [Niveispirillum sp.]